MKSLAIAKGEVRLLLDDGISTPRVVSNLVVLTGSQSLAYLLADPAMADTKALKYFELGTGTNPVLVTDTTITGGYRVNIIGKSYPEIGVVTVSGTVKIEEDLDMVISECGLFSSDGTMYSRVVQIPPFTKPANTALLVDWTLYFKG